MDEKLAIIGAIAVVAVLGGALTVMTPWKTRAEEEGKTITIADMAGRGVEVPKKVDEIIGIEAGALRLVTYLNCTDRVVGVEDFEKREQMGRPYILAHPELSDLPSIGPQHGGDAELITARDPDVIFWTQCTAGDAKDLQKKTGIPVIALKYGDLGSEKDTFYEALGLMGKVLDREKRAEEVIQYIGSIIKDLENRTKDIPVEEKPEVYVGGIGFHGSHGIVSTEPEYTPLQFVNTKNVAGDLGVEHVMVSEEKIVEWNPDILFVDEGGYSLVMDDLKGSEFGTLKAVQNENLYGVLPYNYYTHNYGTILANSYYIGKVLYPEKFSDVEPAEKADEVYEELVGKPVYEEMKRDLGGFQRLESPK